MPAKTLMIQGTGSGVGKSLLVTALCRILHRQGIQVAPFKAVNMSNNASVTQDGGEIATAQAVQAKACGIEPVVEMNPVLLKPTADHSSQVIVSGRPIGVVAAADFRHLREKLLGAIERSLKTLIDSYEFIVIEGAGSPAEINLQETDLANMAVARLADAPVILVADIDRGGAFASMIGTLELLEERDRERVKGFLINKFRGDPALLQSGIDWLEKRTRRPVLGVIPFLQDVRIPEEDSLAERLMNPYVIPAKAGIRLRPDPRLRGDDICDRPIRVQVVRYPMISNFTDFDPLRGEPDVSLEYLTRPPSSEDPPHLLIFPGSKSTVSDLTWLRQAGFDRYAAACMEGGAEILGICGGFQMLGGMIYDPNHVESEVAAVPGLSLLPTNTLFLPSKVTAQVKGVHLESGEPVTGYEIHAGRLQGSRRGKPVFKILERGGSDVQEWDGCQLPQKKIWGTYLHGLFESDRFRRWFLGRLRPLSVQPELSRRMNGALKEDPYDALADAVGPHLSLERIGEISSWPLPV